MKLQVVGIGEFHDCFLDNLANQNITNTSLVTTVYASVLSNDSASFSREKCVLPNFFYVALEFNVSIHGYYSIWSESTINTYGYLYDDVFSPYQPNMNQLASDYGGCGDGQFGIVYMLLTHTRYVFVVTTRLPNETGNFLLKAYGPASVHFIPLGEYTLGEACSCYFCRDSILYDY
jgi:hypothetical protein